MQDGKVNCFHCALPFHEQEINILPDKFLTLACRQRSWSMLLALVFFLKNNTVKLAAVLVRINAFSFHFSKLLIVYIFLYLEKTSQLFDLFNPQSKGSERAFILLSASQVRFPSPLLCKQNAKKRKVLGAVKHALTGTCPFEIHFCLLMKKFPQLEERTDNERFSCQNL